ncbi:MAG: hypothetical protein ACKPKO_28890, partial [Candidatus Fonsibacter sp.]
GAFELEDYNRREMVQRQMHDLLSSIAKSSNLTVDKLKAIIKTSGGPTVQFQMSDPVDMEEAQADLIAQQEEEFLRQIERIRQGKALLRQDLAQSSQAEPAQFNIFGQGLGSSDDPSITSDPMESSITTDPMETAAEEPLDPSLMPVITEEDSGLTSGIIAEQQTKNIQKVNILATILRETDTKALNAAFKELLIKKKKGVNPKIIRLDVRQMSQDDKILKFIMLERGRDPTKPLLLIKDIVKKELW